MKNILIIILLLVLLRGNLTSEEYSLVRIKSSCEMDSVIAKYFSTECVLGVSDDGIDIIVPNSDLTILNKRVNSIEILKSDYESFIENKLIQNKFSGEYILEEKYFKFGSMSSFFTLEEIFSQFDKMIAKFPQYFNSYEIIGKSVEGRYIVAYNFGGSNSSAPSLLITSLHHAREGLGMMSVVYFMWKILENAENGDSEAIYLLNNRRISILPVVNPDGYAFNQAMHPNGGGMWRKNRRLNADSSFGVDINRNYGPEEFWSKDNDFASKSTRSETYRGLSPFSEPETQAVKKFCEDNRFDIALNYHSLGNLLIYPYSSLSLETQDSTLYRYMAENCTKVNEYYYGLDINTVMYSSQGTADDWMYLKSDKKNKIISLTPEVGKLTDQYWLSDLSGEDRLKKLLKICSENYTLNIEALWSAEANLRIRDFRIVPKKDGSGQYLEFEIDNCGIRTSSTDSQIAFLNNDIEFQKKDVLIGELTPGEVKSFSKEFTTAKSMLNGDSLTFLTSIFNGIFARYDTLKVRGFRPLENILFKSAADTSKWVMNSWGIEFDKSGDECYLSDSPGENYPLNSNNTLMLKEPIDLSLVRAAELEFTAKWYIDLEFDIVTFESSTDLGMTWIPLISKRMTAGQGFAGSTHLSGLEALTGVNPLWTKQTIDLTPLRGEQVLLRIILQSGKQIVRDGILFKEIKIEIFNDLPGIVNEDGSSGPEYQIFIPTGEEYRISCPGLADQSDIRIYDILGREVPAGWAAQVEQGYIIIKTGQFITGIYDIVVRSSIQNYKIYRIMVN